MLIEELDLSARAYNCLKRAGIDTVVQLKKMSYADLSCLRGMGQQTLEEVRNLLETVKITNVDYVRSMDDEKLAVWLCSIMTGDCCIQTCPGRGSCKPGHKGILDWLRKEKED